MSKERKNPISLNGSNPSQVPGTIFYSGIPKLPETPVPDIKDIQAVKVLLDKGDTTTVGKWIEAGGGYKYTTSPYHPGWQRY